MAKWVDLSFSSGDTVSGSDFNSMQDMFTAIAEQATDAPFMPSYAMEVAHGVESISASLGISPYPIGNFYPNGFHAMSSARNTTGVFGVDSRLYYRFIDALGATHLANAPFGGVAICSSNYLWYYNPATDTGCHQDYLSANSESDIYSTATFVDSNRLTVGQYNNLLDNFNAFAHGHPDAPKLSTSGDSMQGIISASSSFTANANSASMTLPAGLLSVTVTGSAGDCGYLSHVVLGEPDKYINMAEYVIGNAYLAQGHQGTLIMSTGSNYIFNKAIGAYDSIIYWNDLSTTVESIGSRVYDFTDKEYGHSVVESDINILNDYVTPMLEGVKASSGTRPDMRWNCINHLSYTEGVTHVAPLGIVALYGLLQIMKVDTDNKDLQMLMYVNTQYVLGTHNYTNADKWVRHTWSTSDTATSAAIINYSAVDTRTFHWRKF